MGKFKEIRAVAGNITSEVELLEASLAGSREAFGTIVERYQSLICGIAYSGSGDFARSEELAQETFVRAWKQLRQLKDFGKFRAWLCTIARNLVRKSIKEKQSDAIVGARPLEGMGEVKSEEPGPIETAITKEQEAIVWGALSKIPEQFREPMVLFYRRQQSVSQAASDLGLSEDVVKQRLSRGRKLLRKEVAALVEGVIGNTGPSKVFAVAVLAALPVVTAEAASAVVAGATAKAAPAAKAAFASGLTGAVLGPILGLLGGLLGTWMSIRHTRSPREKRFMAKFSLIVWAELVLLFLIIGLLGVLAAKGIVPRWMFWTVFAIGMMAHAVLLVLAVIVANKRQRQIQKEDGTYVEPTYHRPKMSKANVYGVFGGSIFGAVCWIIPMSSIARDWSVAAVVSIVACLIFLVSTKSCIRDQRRYWLIVIGDMIALCALNLVIVNLRWNSWMAYLTESGRYPEYTRVLLWAINLIVVAVFSGLVLMFFLGYRKQRVMDEKAATS